MDLIKKMRMLVKENLSGRRYIARFNLSAGENFMKWQIYAKGSAKSNAKYYDPSSTSFVFHNAFLRNQCTTAQKIFQGANKTVCAWIEFDSMDVISPNDVNVNDLTSVNYNPKNAPNWLVNGQIADGQTFTKLITLGRKPYILEE